jgi:uncharacterized protein involved in tolerance to divalent cations
MDIDKASLIAVLISAPTDEAQKISRVLITLDLCCLTIASSN